MFDQGKIHEWCKETLEPDTWSISFGVTARLIVDEMGAMAFKITWFPEHNTSDNSG
jgi:hypothetical protein